MTDQQIETAYEKAIRLHHCLQDMSHDEMARIDQAIAETKAWVRILVKQIEDQLEEIVQQAVDDLSLDLYTYDQDLWKASLNRAIVNHLENCNQRIVQDIQSQIQDLLLQEIDQLHAFATTADHLTQHIDSQIPTLAIQKLEATLKRLSETNATATLSSVVLRFGDLWNRYKRIAVQIKTNHFTDPEFMFGAGTLRGLLQLPLLSNIVFTVDMEQIDEDKENHVNDRHRGSIDSIYRNKLITKLEKQFNAHLPVIQDSVDSYITVYFNRLKHELDISLRQIRNHIDQLHQVDG